VNGSQYLFPSIPDRKLKVFQKQMLLKNFIFKKDRGGREQPCPALKKDNVQKSLAERERSDNA